MVEQVLLMGTAAHGEDPSCNREKCEEGAAERAVPEDSPHSPSTCLALGEGEGLRNAGVKMR